MSMSTSVYLSLTTILDRDITNPPKHESTWKLYVRNPASSALDHLLAEDFDIMDGSLDVTVPDIRSGPYEVVCEFSLSI